MQRSRHIYFLNTCFEKIVEHHPPKIAASFTMRITPLMIKMIGTVLLFFLLTPAHGNDMILKNAELAYHNKDFDKSERLYNKLTSSDAYQTRATLGLAKVAFHKDQFDVAKTHIQSLLKASPKQAEHQFWAARIYAKLAQNASVFKKFGLAKTSKKHFIKALVINPLHKPSLIGLIKFHQQAPSIVGGDKDQIPVLLKRLRSIDPDQAFSIEVTTLFKEGKIDQAFKQYNAQLKHAKNPNKMTFDFAMLLAQQQLYIQALVKLKAINTHDQTVKDPYIEHMRLYQMAKCAAESQSDIDLGLKSIREYIKTPESDNKISKDWVDFRLAQLLYLSNDKGSAVKLFKTIHQSSSDDDLKKRVSEYL